MEVKYNMFDVVQCARYALQLRTPIRYMFMYGVRCIHSDIRYTTVMAFGMRKNQGGYYRGRGGGPNGARCRNETFKEKPPPPPSARPCRLRDEKMSSPI